MKKKNLLQTDTKEDLMPEKPPLLFLDVNISEGKNAKLMLFEGD
jgi:hypothetical protein